MIGPYGTNDRTKHSRPRATLHRLHRRLPSDSARASASALGNLERATVGLAGAGAAVAVVEDSGIGALGVNFPEAAEGPELIGLNFIEVIFRAAAGPAVASGPVGGRVARALIGFLTNS